MKQGKIKNKEELHIYDDDLNVCVPTEYDR